MYDTFHLVIRLPYCMPKLGSVDRLFLSVESLQRENAHTSTIIVAFLLYLHGDGIIRTIGIIGWWVEWGGGDDESVRSVGCWEEVRVVRSEWLISVKHVLQEYHILGSMSDSFSTDLLRNRLVSFVHEHARSNNYKSFVIATAADDWRTTKRGDDDDHHHNNNHQRLSATSSYY